MSITAETSNEEITEVDLSYCRAALYSALAIGFQPPSHDNLERLLAPDSRSSLARIADTLYPLRQPDLISLLNALPTTEPDDTSIIAACHRALFGHTAHGLIPPYETEYGNEALFQQPQELGDLMGFYRAFGLSLKQAEHERPDHISCECEFMMFLALKESYALEQDQTNMLAEVRKAQKLFLRDHLARFLPAFTNRLNREEPHGFYSTLAELAIRFVVQECVRMGIRPGSANLDLRPADDARVPMACGSGAECAAMPGVCAPPEADSV